MAEEAQPKQHDPLFSEVEIIATTLGFLILDVADIFEVGVPASDVISWATQAYQYKKGTNGVFQVISAGIEAIPGVDIFPVRTIAVLMIFWGDRHPDGTLAKLIKVAEVVAEVKGKAGAQKAEGAVAKEAEGSAREGIREEIAERRNRQGVGGVDTGRTLEEDTEAAAKMSGAAGAEEKEAYGARTREHARRFGQATGGEEGEEEGGEGEEQDIEDRRLDTILKGRYIEELAEKSMSAEGVMGEIGEKSLGDKPSRFDPDAAMEPKPIRRPKAANDNSIIDSERVDLSKNDPEDLDLAA